MSGERRDGSDVRRGERERARPTRGFGGRAGRIGAVALAVAVVAIGGSGAAAAADSVPESPRTLVLSLPGITWEDLAAADVPVLEGLLAGSGVANLATRVERLKSSPGDSYATIGAGTRALAPLTVGGLAFAPDEAFENGTAGEAFARQEARPLDGAVGHLRFTPIVAENEDSLYEADIGALGDALAAAGVDRGVVANADWSDEPHDLVDYHREAALALVGSDGTVPCGRIDTGLLRRDPARAMGLTLDHALVVDAFEQCFAERSVVLVEASDLRRIDDAGDRLGATRRAALTQAALRDVDTLLAELLESIDLESDAVVVVAPVPRQSDVPRLTVFAVHAPGFGPGLLESGVTRQAGFVSIVDVGPTIAALAGAPVDEDAMEGRAVSVARSGGTAAERVDFLVGAEADARFRDRVLTPFIVTFIVSELVLTAFASLVLWRKWRLGLVVEVGALALLAALPLTYWAAALPFADWGPAAYFAFTLGGGLALGAGAALPIRRLVRPLALVLGLMLATTVTSVVVLGSRLQLSAVFGDSPIVAGRFTGINNVTFAQVMVATILLGVFLRRGRTDRRSLLEVAALFVFVELVIGAPMWGADVGGVLAGLPAFALVVTLFAGWKVRLRTLVTWGLVTVGTLLALGVFDLQRDSSERSHLGRLFERVADEGWDGFALVLARKLDANFATLTSSVWRFVLIPMLGVAALLVWRAPGGLRRLQERIPEMRAGLIGIGAAGLLGYAVNDSGIAVPGVMLAVLAPAMIYLVSRIGPEP